MTWFALQSAIMLLLTFVLGALVGYWYWRIQYRRVAFTESEAVTVISRRHEKVLAEKDAEIGRLQGLVAGGAGAAVLADGDVRASVDGDDAAVRGDAASDADPVDVPADQSADAPADEPAVAAADADASAGAVEEPAQPEAAEAVAGDPVPADDAPAEDAPADDAPADEAAAGATADATGDATATDEAPADAAEAVEVIEVPDSEPENGPVVDVTDGALAADDGQDTDAAARAVAQLPTQGSPEPVIDLSETTGTPADETAEPDGTDAAAPVATGVAAGLVGEEAGTTGTAEEEVAADDGVEDDLERIEGIGPRIASALRTAGIRSFRRLADADVPTLQAALEAAGLRFAPSLPTWSRQARFLADGDEVGFIKLTESLVAGREPGRSR